MRKNTVMKLVVFCIITALILQGFGRLDFAQAEDTTKPINIIVMGRKVSFPDQQPVFINSRTMVPVRLTEEFDFEVDWKGDKVFVSDEKNVIIFTIGSDVMTINGVPQRMDVKAQMLNNRTMVPLRYLTEPFGYDVRFENKSNEYTISLVLKESAEDVAQKQLMEKMGLTDVLYPIYDDVETNPIMMRIEDAAARGSGKGISILDVNNEKYLDKALTKLAPSAKVDTAASLPDNLAGYDIVSIHSNIWKNYDMNEVASKYPDTLFLVTIDYYFEPPWNKPAIDNSAHFDAVNNLTQPNIMKLGRGFMPLNGLYENTPIADLYIADTSDQAQSIAAGVFADFLETHKDMKAVDMKSYVSRHSKEHIYMCQPREDFNKRIPISYKILDAHLLFSCYDDDPAILDTLNLSNYTGKGVKVAIIDSDFNLKGLEDKVKSQIVVSEDNSYGYQNYYGKATSSHGRDMLCDFLDVAPDAEVHTILTGPWRGSWEGQDAQDIANALYKAKELNVDVVSMSFALNFNKNENIKQAIRSLCESGILVSWFWSAETLDNQFRTRCGDGAEKALGPDGVFMLICYDKDFYRSQTVKWSVSGTAPRMAGILAQILEAHPDVTGKEIKELIKYTGVKVSETHLQGYNTMPNISRLISILDNKLTVEKELYLNTPIQLSFSKSCDVRINGVINDNTSTLSVAGAGHFTIQIQDDDEIIVEPATQQVSVLLLKNNTGQYYLDATFNGTIQTDVGTIEVKKGINALEKAIGTIYEIQIKY